MCDSRDTYTPSQSIELGVFSHIIILCLVGFALAGIGRSRRRWAGVFNIALRRLRTGLHIIVGIIRDIIITGCRVLEGRLRLDDDGISFLTGMGRWNVLMDGLRVGQVAIALIAVGYTIGSVVRQRRSMPVDGTSFRWGRHVDTGDGTCLLQETAMSVRFPSIQSLNDGNAGLSCNTRFRIIRYYQILSEEYA